ncbi:MAG: uroporphyrinogen decarboxylase family protein [Halanaerobiaceae bacterium]
MNSKEIIQKTLDFTGPRRVGRSFGDSDFASAGHNVDTPATGWEKVAEKRWERTDEWGNKWARVDPTSKGEVVEGALSGVEDIEDYQFPDFSNFADYKSVQKKRKEVEDKWLIGWLPGFTFNIARKLLKLDKYLTTILLEKELIHKLHDKIDAMLEDMIVNYARAGVDSVMFPEDWGTQDQTFISPDLWQEEFYPRFKKLCSLAHDNGIRVFMHSCGKMTAIIPGLIEAGIDVLQFDQPRVHGIDTLASFQEDNKITFWCPVDIQKDLQTKDEEQIRAGAREMLDELWQGRGGFIAGYYGDNDSIGLDPKWQDIACEEFIEKGKKENYM